MINSHSAAARSLIAGIRAIARSFRFHRPRGAFCYQGWCQQCKVLDSSGRVVLACEQSADSRWHRVPRRFPGRVAGVLAECLTPWFWERVAYRGSPARQPFLAAVRHMSSAASLPALPEGPVCEDKKNLERHCDALVIGGGLSGLVSAATLARAGRQVILVSASQLKAHASSAVRGSDEASEWIAKVRESAEVHEGQLCIGLYEDGSRARCTGSSYNLSISFDTLVVATGAYDRLPTVPGNDLPGLIGVRGFEALAHAGGLPAHFKVGAYGNPIELSRALDAARASGIELDFIAGPEGFPDRSLPGLVGHLRSIRGTSSGLRSVQFQDGTTRTCDLLISCLSQPSYELQVQRGARIALRGEEATLCALDTDKGDLIMVGEAAGWFDRTDCIKRTIAAITAWMESGSAPEPAAWVHHEPHLLSPLPDDAYVCLCEDVRVRDIELAIAQGYADIELLKRHTGAGTGPCQGKLCHGPLLQCAAVAGLKVDIPTSRPFIRPVLLSRLITEEHI